MAKNERMYNENNRYNNRKMTVGVYRSEREARGHR